MIQQEFQVFTKEEQEFIRCSVLSAGIDWTNGQKYPYHEPEKVWNFEMMTHLTTRRSYGAALPMFVHRLVERSESKGEPGVVVSKTWEFFEPIFHRIREKMELPFQHILRSSLNATWSQEPLHGDPHLDHYGLRHYNMILHLTPISQGGTFIFDDNHNILEESSPAVWSATAFEGLWHAQGFCAPGETRIICVITWQ